jgi:hypothetical protein
VPFEVISPGDHGQTGRDHGLAGHTAVGILGEIGVEHAVGDPVGQLVGVAHADGFAGEEILALCHDRSLVLGWVNGRAVESNGPR